ncbi:hypothetical protein M9Y10_034215 [Tritrichomonas musculus]|uniref:Transmembrane protein n=1 Tax=Tritrichomonas musculus TaxID=1915356 RepID=A0ABR2KEY3_9EUKA
MAIFGGDPRYVYNQVLYKILLWYDIVMIPSLLIALSRDFYRPDTLFLPVPFIFFELIRLALNSSHTNGNIPVYVAYLFICFIDLGIDLASIFVVRNTAFFYVTFFGYAIFHFIQLCWSVPVYQSFQKYQDAFYQFSQEQIRSQALNQDDGTVQLELNVG